MNTEQQMYNFLCWIFGNPEDHSYSNYVQDKLNHGLAAMQYGDHVQNMHDLLQWLHAFNLGG